MLWMWNGATATYCTIRAAFTPVTFEPGISLVESSAETELVLSHGERRVSSDAWWPSSSETNRDILPDASHHPPTSRDETVPEISEKYKL